MTIRSLIDDKKKQKVQDAIKRGDNSVFRKRKEAVKPEEKPKPAEPMIVAVPKPVLLPPVQVPAPVIVPPAPQPPPHPLYQGNPWASPPQPAPQRQPPAPLYNPVQTVEVHKAVLRGDLARVKAAVDNGANVDAPNDVGDTPVMVAAQLGSIEIVRYLMSQAASTSIEAPNTRRNALMYAAMYGHEDVVAILSNMPAAAARDHQGMTALFLAVTKGKHRIVRLLSKNSDMDARNKDDMTPLMHAAKYNDLETTIILLDSGADIFASNKAGQSALSLAVEFGSTDTAQLLLERGAMNGLTVLDHAELMKKAKSGEMKKLLKKHMK